MMEFTLEELKACIVQNAILQFTDFTTDNFWNRFEKLAVLKRICSQKSLWTNKVVSSKAAILPKRQLTLDLAEKPP